jgi:hypothetical protein
LPKIPQLTYLAMAGGGLAGVAFGAGYSKLVLGQPALWPLVLFAIVGECMAGERAVRRYLGPLGPVQAARFAIPYTLCAAGFLGAIALWQESWWADAAARIAGLSPIGVIATVLLSILTIAMLGLARTLLLSALSPSR